MVQSDGKAPDVRVVDCFKGYCLTLFYEGVRLPALIDTGATVSIISGAFISKLPSLQRLIRGSKLTSIGGIGDSKISVRGEVSCIFNLEGEISFENQTLHVIEGSLSIPVILGMDFLRRNKIIIDVANNKLLKQNDDFSIIELPMSLEMFGESSCLYCLKTEVIGPGERKLVQVTLDRSLEGQGCVVPRVVGGGSPFVLAGSINVMEEGMTSAEICNMSREPITVRRGTEIGLWQPVCQVVRSIVGPGSDRELIGLLKIENIPISSAQRVALEQLIQSYRDVFSIDDDELGFCNTIEHSIDVGSSLPIKQRFRRLHPPLKEKVETELQRMEKQGVIEKSTSPWCSPLVPVRKKDGRIRICVDYRKLNSVTKLESFPLPNIEDNLAQFAGAQYFSTLDLLSGYHQVALAESSKEKTAFATERGLYQYRVMPQGACGSPATFQRLMNVVLGGIPSCRALAYLDDILVVGTSFDDHMNNLGEVFERLRAHGLKLSVGKCNLFKSEVLYLGHVLSNEGIKPIM